MMKNKSLVLSALSVFAFILLASFASAALTAINLTSAPTSINESTTSFNIVFDLTSSAAGENLVFTSSTINVGSIVFDTASIESETLPITATVTLPAGFSGGVVSGTINATGTTSSTSQALPFSVNVLPSDVLESDTIGNTVGSAQLQIKKIELTNKGSQYASFGEEDNEWFPGEEVTVEITVDNNGDWDLADIQVSWGLWSTDANDWIIDFDEEGSDFNLDHGDDKVITVTFIVDDSMDFDVDELVGFATDSYKFYVVATGVVDDNDAGVLDEEPISANDFESSKIITDESDFVILNDFVVPESVSCGTNVELTADLWNIGDDQDDITINIYNKELGLDEDITIDNIDSFDTTPLSFTFTVPTDVESKTYSLRFTVYDEDMKEFVNDYNDDESVFDVPFTVSGSCTAKVSVTANLESEAVAGKEVVVKATIKNTGTKPVTYSLQASGFDSWAESAELDKTSVTLNAGASTDVLVTLAVKNSVSGEQSFSLDLLSNNEVVASQEVSLPITASTFSLTGWFSNLGESGSNWTIWAIVALNVIVVVAIITVAVRVLRKNKQ